MNKLKTCSVCGNVWMADISFCPYCNMSPEARINGMKDQQKIESLERKLNKKENENGRK